MKADLQFHQWVRSLLSRVDNFEPEMSQVTEDSQWKWMSEIIFPLKMLQKCCNSGDSSVCMVHFVVFQSQGPIILLLSLLDEDNAYRYDHPKVLAMFCPILFEEGYGQVTTSSFVSSNELRHWLILYELNVEVNAEVDCVLGNTASGLFFYVARFPTIGDSVTCMIAQRMWAMHFLLCWFCHCVYFDSTLWWFSLVCLIENAIESPVVLNNESVIVEEGKLKCDSMCITASTVISISLCFGCVLTTQLLNEGQLQEAKKMILSLLKCFIVQHCLLSKINVYSKAAENNENPTLLHEFYDGDDVEVNSNVIDGMEMVYSPEKYALSSGQQVPMSWLPDMLLLKLCNASRGAFQFCEIGSCLKSLIFCVADCAKFVPMCGQLLAMVDPPVMSWKHDVAAHGFSPVLNLFLLLLLMFYQAYDLIPTLSGMKVYAYLSDLCCLSSLWFKRGDGGFWEVIPIHNKKPCCIAKKLHILALQVKMLFLKRILTLDTHFYTIIYRCIFSNDVAGWLHHSGQFLCHSDLLTIEAYSNL